MEYAALLIMTAEINNCLETEKYFYNFVETGIIMVLHILS